MITRVNNIKIEEFSLENCLDFEDNKEIFKEALFFDLEHYVYKKPVCLGVFGCAYYDEKDNQLKVTQYMMENKKDSKEILYLSKKYFEDMYNNHNKKYIVTFSGNNDFTVIKYLLNKNKIEYTFHEDFKEVDLQKCYENFEKTSIGLKNLEKKFDIIRESELISGSNLAKTFGKIMNDNDYINRMPEDKKEKILLYNEQDVVSLFHIYVNWYRGVQKRDENTETKEQKNIG